MHAVVFSQSRKVELADRPVPEAGVGEVLLRPLFCGICGTDLHAPNLDHFRPGVVMGHEFSAEVVGVGKEVSGWQVGDRVAVNPNGNVCGRCAACREGRYNLCAHAVFADAVGIHRDGGMAELVAVPARVLHRLPDSVSGLQGAWVEPVATAIRAVRISGFAVGDRAVILGGGPIGLLVLQTLRRAGAGWVAVVEPSAYRRDFAIRLGADEAIEPPLAGDVSELFGRDLERPSHVFECSGQASAVRVAVRICRHAGTVTVVGISPEAVDFPAFELVGKELRIQGSIIYVDEFPVAINLLAIGAYDVESLSTNVVDLTRAAEAFETLRKPDAAVKVLLHP